MFSRLKNFTYRHKKKFIVGGIVVSGAILASKYAQRKLLEWQDQEAKAFLESTRREQHFRNTENTCNQTIFSLAKTLRETLMKITNTDDILLKIRSGESNKIHLWDTLKVRVFAELSALLYTGLMLVIVLRVQLNVLGGYMFREKMDSQTQEVLSSSSFQEHYLSLCNYFLDKGVKDICTLMETHAHLVLENISLKQKLSLQDIEHIFWAIQSSLSNDPCDPLKNLNKYLLPPQVNSAKCSNNIETEKLRLLINETSDILESEEVKSIADTCIKRAYSNVVDQIAPSYQLVNSSTTQQTGPTSVQEDDGFKNITKVSVPLAKIVPVVHGLYKGAPDEGDDDITSWIYPFLFMDNINMLGANLYEAFSNVQ